MATQFTITMYNITKWLSDNKPPEEEPATDDTLGDFSEEKTDD